MDFIYPFHQAIGFYLVKAGYDSKYVALFQKEINLRFYLTYNIRNKAFLGKWKLYYAKTLD